MNDQPYCMNCGKPMKHNVPRLGPDGGWVHADTGYPLCGKPPSIEIEGIVWTYLKDNDPQTEKENHHLEN